MFPGVGGKSCCGSGVEAKKLPPGVSVRKEEPWRAKGEGERGLPTGDGVERFLPELSLRTSTPPPRSSSRADKGFRPNWFRLSARRSLFEYELPSFGRLPAASQSFSLFPLLSAGGEPFSSTRRTGFPPTVGPPVFAAFSFHH